MNLGAKLKEGKTKIIYANPDDLATEIMFFKDSITAGDGAKKDTISGKGAIDWQTHVNIMEYLKRRGLQNLAFHSALETGCCLIKKVDKILPLEIVARRVAAGSVLSSGFEEGQKFDPLYHQIFYKDDFLHDPLLDDNFLRVIEEKYQFPIFSEARTLSEKIFLLLEEAFARENHQYIDQKIEVGIIFNGQRYDSQQSQIVLVDEITAGSMRVWPYAKANPDLSQPNVLSELDKSGMKDKQLYREGKSLDQVKKGFEQIMEMTARFE